VEFIRQEMQERNLSINELARQAKISPGTLADVLNGKKNPGTKFFKQLAPVLGVTPDYLFSLTLEDKK